MLRDLFRAAAVRLPGVGVGAQLRLIAPASAAGKRRRRFCAGRAAPADSFRPARQLPTIRRARATGAGAKRDGQSRAAFGPRDGGELLRCAGEQRADRRGRERRGARLLPPAPPPDPLLLASAQTQLSITTTTMSGCCSAADRAG